MTGTVGPEPTAVALAEQIAAVVTAHPAVAGLHGGPFGAIATHLPGRRLVGVRVGMGAEPVELAVVLHLDRPIPGVVADLRRAVAGLCAGAPVLDSAVLDSTAVDSTAVDSTAVDITVADVAVPARHAAEFACGGLVDTRT